MTRNTPTQTDATRAETPIEAELAPTGLTLELVRERHRVLPARGGSEDIAFLLAEVERLQTQLADAWDEGLWAGKVLAAQAVGPGPAQHPENPYRP